MPNKKFISKTGVTFVNFLIALLSTGVFLGILEAGLRLEEDMDKTDATINQPWDGKGENLLHIRSGNPNLVYELRPNTDVMGFRTNSAGFRDSEFKIQRQPGVFRAIAIGDSVTFGWTMPVEETYPKALERMCSQPDKREMEVFNMGIGGYDTLQEVEMVKAKALSYKPDLIILGYVLNDNQVAADNGLWQHFTRSGSYLYDYLNLRLLRLGSKFGKSIAERGFEVLAKTTGRTGTPVLVIIFPVGKEEGGTYPYKQEHDNIAKLAKNHGFGVIDLLGPFREVGLSKVFSGNDTVHPNKNGHYVAARVIYDYLKMNNLVNCSFKR